MYDSVRNLHKELDKSIIGDNKLGSEADADLDNRRHGFLIGDTGLLLPNGMLCEIRSDLPVSWIPNAPSWVVGLVNLRGNIAPVLDIAEVLNIEASSSAEQEQLFFQIDDEWVGIRSNGLPRLLTLSEEDFVEDAPEVSEQLRPYMLGCYQKDILWIDCDIESIFGRAMEEARR